MWTGEFVYAMFPVDRFESFSDEVKRLLIAPEEASASGTLPHTLPPPNAPPETPQHRADPSVNNSASGGPGGSGLGGHQYQCHATTDVVHRNSCTLAGTDSQVWLGLPVPGRRGSTMEVQRFDMQFADMKAATSAVQQRMEKIDVKLDKLASAVEAMCAADKPRKEQHWLSA